MKKVLFFLLACIIFSNTKAAIPEDGIYTLVSVTDDYSYYHWRDGKPALLVIMDGTISQAFGILDINFFPSHNPPILQPPFPQIDIDLREMEFTKQSDGSFTLSFNTETMDTGITIIQPGRFFALHGILNFESPVTGIAILTIGIAALTSELKPVYKVTTNSFYINKL